MLPLLALHRPYLIFSSDIIHIKKFQLACLPLCNTVINRSDPPLCNTVINRGDPSPPIRDYVIYEWPLSVTDQGPFPCGL